MSFGAVSSSAPPRMNDSSATIAERVSDSGQPASANPRQTASYIRLVRENGTSGRTARMAMVGGCAANAPR